MMLMMMKIKMMKYPGEPLGGEIHVFVFKVLTSPKFPKWDHLVQGRHFVKALTKAYKL